MEQITKPHCGARLDRLPDCRWHSSMFAVVAFGLLVCWSNAVGGLILAQLKELGWTDNSTTATFSAITTAGMFLGALVGGIIGDKTGRRNAFILYEAIHIAAMVVGAFSPNMSFLIACRFVMGVGLGALLVTLFAGFTEYMPGRNRAGVIRKPKRSCRPLKQASNVRQENRCRRLLLKAAASRRVPYRIQRCSLAYY